jgi:hypothetical protein
VLLHLSCDLHTGNTGFEYEESGQATWVLGNLDTLAAAGKLVHPNMKLVLSNKYPDG